MLPNLFRIYAGKPGHSLVPDEEKTKQHPQADRETQGRVLSGDAAALY